MVAVLTGWIFDYRAKVSIFGFERVSLQLSHASRTLDEIEKSVLHLQESNRVATKDLGGDCFKTPDKTSSVLWP